MPVETKYYDHVELYGYDRVFAATTNDRKLAKVARRLEADGYEVWSNNGRMSAFRHDVDDAGVLGYSMVASTRPADPYKLESLVRVSEIGAMISELKERIVGLEERMEAAWGSQPLGPDDVVCYGHASARSRT
jgi:hypothetical protein